MAFGRSTGSRFGRAFGGLAIAFAAVVSATSGACSAEGNDIPVEVVRDASGRDVINGQESDSSITASDASSSSSDSGSSQSDAAPTDSSALPTCNLNPTGQGGTCTAAVDLGSVSGDENPSINSITFTGKGSQWLSVLVTEDVSGVLDHDLSVRVTLNSPTGANYDLFAYVDPSGTATTRACTTASGQSNNAEGVADVVNLLWDDSKVGSSDDTRIVSIKVDHVSGPCGPNDEWSITVEGHPQ